MGDVIVLVVLAGIIALIVYSMWKNRKKGCHCSGCSNACSGCSSCSTGDVVAEQSSGDK